VGEPGVVVVLVRDDDPLGVLELQPVRPSALDASRVSAHRAG
jgi:hypothetical protein